MEEDQVLETLAHDMEHTIVENGMPLFVDNDDQQMGNTVPFFQDSLAYPRHESPQLQNQNIDEQPLADNNDNDIDRESINTNDLTDLYQSDHDQKNPSQQPSSKGPTRKQLLAQVASLTSVVEEQKVQISDSQKETEKQKSKVDKLLEIIKKQQAELLQLKQSSAPQQAKNSVVDDKNSNFWHEEDRDQFYEEVNGGKGKGTRRTEDENSSLPPKSIKSQKLQAAKHLGSEKGGSLITRAPQGVITRQDSKQNILKEAQQQSDLMQTEMVPPIQAKKQLIIKKQTKPAAGYIAKRMKQINEDLALVASNQKGIYLESQRASLQGDQNGEGSQEGEDDQKILQPAQYQNNQLALSLPRKQVSQNYTRLEALKFKMTLQLRNIKLLTDHDTLMRGLEKAHVGSQKRDNKLYNIHQITRLERDIERTSKQLKQEIYAIALKAKEEGKSDISEGDQVFVMECEELFKDADNYFDNKEHEKMQKLVKKDYSQVNSRINTNLAGARAQQPPIHQNLQRPSYEYQGSMRNNEDMMMEMNGDLPEENYNEEGDEEEFEGDTVPDIRGIKPAQVKKQIVQRRGGGNRQIQQDYNNNDFENQNENAEDQEPVNLENDLFGVQGSSMGRESKNSNIIRIKRQNSSRGGKSQLNGDEFKLPTIGGKKIK